MYLPISHLLLISVRVCSAYLFYPAVMSESSDSVSLLSDITAEKNKYALQK